MSGKGKIPKRKVDRRVSRTRDKLGDALMGLMHQQPFTKITVQHILDRAQIGRSTFYSHFSDKQDLLLSDMEDFLEAAATALSRKHEPSNRVAPVRELFAHAAQMHNFRSALVAADKWRDFIDMAEGHFARGIRQRLAELSPASAISARQPAAVAHALAGAMLSLMSWWLEHSNSASPEQMDDLFHQIVWQGNPAR